VELSKSYKVPIASESAELFGRGLAPTFLSGKASGPTDTSQRCENDYHSSRCTLNQFPYVPHLAAIADIVAVWLFFIVRHWMR